MNYLAYYEIPEFAGYLVSDDINVLKAEWCFSLRIFEVPDDFSMVEFNKQKKPRYHYANDTYKLIHSEGTLMHVNE